MKKWKTVNELKNKNKKVTVDDVLTLLLENRGLKTKEEIADFLHPELEQVTIDAVGIDTKQLKKALKRITKAIEKKEKIVVFGDYDVDGITGTAILWEALYALGAHVMPYIPHRVDEGYGLSIKGIENVQEQILKQVQDDKGEVQDDKKGLIITVDNGIVANAAVDFAKKAGIDVIITDHHTVGVSLPKAHAIVHTTKVCGAAVGWLLAKEIATQFASAPEDRFLDLVALATVADLVPLTGQSRALLQAGLPYLRKTKRPGLQALFQEAQIDPHTIGVYEIGHIIGPRINAMGRLESAMDSLRLLCTNKSDRAKQLATTLGITNRERQLLTQSASLHAIEQIKSRGGKQKKLLFVTENYEEGIIGLVAGKLVEAFYRPAIVLSKGEKISKASARSVGGFNIIEFIRSQMPLLINAGGHPMAAGFTIESGKISLLQEALEKAAEEMLTDELLIRSLHIDCELPLSFANQQLFDGLQVLAPFGMGNPEPVFVSKNVSLEHMMVIGRDKKHLKFYCKNDETVIEAIAFGMGDQFNALQKEKSVTIAYTINENEWNGRKKIQLKIRDIATQDSM